MDCAGCFLTANVVDIFKTGSAAGINRLYACLDKLHKASFFDRVPHSWSEVPLYMITDLKESAFHESWEAFCLQMRNGALISKEDCTGYIFTIFKRRYLKLLLREQRRITREKTMGGHLYDQESETVDLVKLKQAMAALEPNCAKFLNEKKVLGKSAEEMAAARNITPAAVDQMVWRCKKRFLEIWKRINAE